MTGMTISDLFQESLKNGNAKSQKNKLDVLKSRARENESVKISSVDEKEILQLRNEWKELILDTEKLRADYDMLIREMKELKEISIAIECGSTWKYKLARWLIG